MYISVDLDNTLLHINKDLSEYSLKVLKKCQELGHIVIINTARNFIETEKLMDIIKPDYTSCNAGSMIYDKSGKLIRKNLFSKEKTNEIVKKIFPYLDYINIQTVDKLYTTRIDNANPKLEYYDGKDGYYLEAGKILCNKLDFNDGIKFSKELDIEFMNYHSGNWSRFTPKGSTKLDALKYIVSITNGSMEDTISFGDDHGDIDMILGSHIGVCMANSEEDVLEKVSIVISHCDEDGVCKYLDNYFKLNINRG